MGEICRMGSDMRCAVIQSPIGRLMGHKDVRAGESSSSPRSRSVIVIVLDLELVLDFFRLERSKRWGSVEATTYDRPSWLDSPPASRTTTTTRTRRIGGLERNESLKPLPSDPFPRNVHQIFADFRSGWIR
jgi:hypothetical protein